MGLYPTGEESHQSYPAVDSVTDNNDQSGKMHNGATSVTGVTNHVLTGLKA